MKILLPILFLFLISCSNEINSGVPAIDTNHTAVPVVQQKFDANSMRPLLSGIEKQLCGYRLRGSYDSLMNLYTESAIISPDKSTFRSGIDAIRFYWMDYDGMMMLSRNAISFEGNDRMICETGIETGSMNGTQKHNRASWNYKYLTIWEKQADGSWKIMAEMLNELE